MEVLSVLGCLMLESLKKLGAEYVRKFHGYLTQPVLDGCQPIPESLVENKGLIETVTTMISSYGEESAVDVTVEILKTMNLKNEAEKLQNARTAAQNPPSSSSSGLSLAAGSTVSAQSGSVIMAPNIASSSAGSINININQPNTRPGPRADI